MMTLLNLLLFGVVGVGAGAALGYYLGYQAGLCDEYIQLMHDLKTAGIKGDE